MLSGTRFKKSASLKKMADRDINLLNKYFLGQEGTPDFPFTLSLHALENLETTLANDNEFNRSLLEDIIFSSLYATFYETIFLTIKENPTMAIPLIHGFDKSTEEREDLISKQTECHVRFVLNKGVCSGCHSCEHHSDVAELLPHWEKRDMDFFILLYLGMQTIWFSMEHILYDIIPTEKNIITYLDQKHVLQFRQFIYSYVEAHYK